MSIPIITAASPPMNKGAPPCDVREMIALRKERRALEDGILEALRRNATATVNLQHKTSEIGGGLAGAGSETKGARRNRRAKTKKRSGAGPPLCHGNGGRGQQPAPPQGASELSSTSPGTPSEPPATHDPTIVPGLPQRHGNGGRGQQRLLRRA